MIETEFPQIDSGPWTGFYMESHLPRRSWMHLYLAIEEGQLTGEGTDYVGTWHAHGTVDLDRQRCEFIKQYLGQHRVEYRGAIGPDGIRGTWNIGSAVTGPFHIWPAGWSEVTGRFLEQELPATESPQSAR